jgi:LETM1 and EF-hand domain-containing protein 1
MIWKHRQYVAEIRARVKDEGQNEPLTRWESRFTTTHQADMTKWVSMRVPLSLFDFEQCTGTNRLPFFVLTFIVLEEIIPLIILFAPAILPSTCILPSQHDKIRLAQDKAQIASLAGASQLRSVQDGVEGLRRMEAKLLCGSVSLSLPSIDGPLFRGTMQNFSLVEPWPDIISPRTYRAAPARRR